MNEIDGPTLCNCKSEEDVKELGIDITAKARVLLSEVVKFKESGVPVEHLIGTKSNKVRLDTVIVVIR